VTTVPIGMPTPTGTSAFSAEPQLGMAVATPPDPTTDPPDQKTDLPSGTLPTGRATPAVTSTTTSDPTDSGSPEPPR
jgi:hypothetical protein